MRSPSVVVVVEVSVCVTDGGREGRRHDGTNEYVCSVLGVSKQAGISC